MKSINVVSCSGGKDSTATYLECLERGGKEFDLMAYMPSQTCVLAGGLCE